MSNLETALESLKHEIFSRKLAQLWLISRLLGTKVCKDIVILKSGKLVFSSFVSPPSNIQHKNPSTN